MRYLSVCSGIEAASVAWGPLGWSPLAFSEVAPFPRSVLQHHYPEVPLYGDFTALRDQPWIADAELLVGGTPCQSFSLAGNRQSLGDARGVLALEFIRLANAIDDFRLLAGKQPARIVWENVPSVLNTDDNAFGCFLAGLCGC
jgi:DNA (cytosine-5)-methyltransferase 1